MVRSGSAIPSKFPTNLRGRSAPRQPTEFWGYPLVRPKTLPARVRARRAQIRSAANPASILSTIGVLCRNHNARCWQDYFYATGQTPRGLSAMPRVRIGPALPGREQLDVEITRLRDLNIGELRNRWHAVFGRPAPAHLPRHLLFRVVAYRLQADRFGDLDSESQRLLDHSGSPEKAAQSAVDLVRRIVDVRPGTVLDREWNGRTQCCRDHSAGNSVRRATPMLCGSGPSMEAAQS
jgi:hypothetical protein